MKFLKYLVLTITIFIAIGIYIIYGAYHGKMYMNRVFSMSQDGSHLFIGDFNRTQLFGQLYLNYYIINSYLGGQTFHEEYYFLTFSKNVSAHKNLSEYREMPDYEITKNNIQLTYTPAKESLLKINTGDIYSYFVTKTDPEYFRFIGNGSGNIEINGKQIPAHIIVDTMISHDSSHSRLLPGTKINGFMGGFWDTEGNTSYFDKTEILEKEIGETYTPHAYLLSLSHDKQAKKSYDLEVAETSSEISVRSNNTLVFSVKKENIIKIGNQILQDTYYVFKGVNGSGSPINGFLNFVK
ncbi:hypothetical protein KA057_03275 [Candidatus Gracilibacteria bacterium]|nr:hypothetical protein [Candidatus Gracilibacteria bacterium]